MKPFINIILLLFVLTVPALTQEKDLPPAQTELVNAERAFAKLAVERGVRESFIAYFADDGIGFAPHPHKVKERFSNNPAPATRPAIVLNWAPVYGDIAQAGDLGWNTGPTVVEDTGPEKKPTRHGMFFSVWKRQSDGSWRVALDLGVDTPAAVAPLNAPFKTSYRASSKHHTTSVSVEEEIAGLLKVEREFLAAAKASSLGQAYQSRLSDDARIQRPGVMPVVGKEALRGWTARQTMTLSGEPIKADVSGSGDLGYAYGSYELGGAQPQKGYFARVWKRDDKGQWRIVIDTVSPLPPGTSHLAELPELMDREKEIEMALSAAPEHLRKEAAVYVLQRGGYVKAREGSNGFTCLIEREGVKGTSPLCFDKEGSETTLLMVFRKSQLIEQGKEQKEVERVIDEEYLTGKLLAPRKQGVAYMLSTEFKTHDHKSGKMVTVFPPHVMFYAPYMKNSDIGARPGHRGSVSQPWILNEGKPYAYIIVVPKEKQFD